MHTIKNLDLRIVMSDFFSLKFELWIVLVLTVVKIHFYFQGMKRWCYLLIKIFVVTCIYIYFESQTVLFQPFTITNP